MFSSEVSAGVVLKSIRMLADAIVADNCIVGNLATNTNITRVAGYFVSW